MPHRSHRQDGCRDTALRCLCSTRQKVSEATALQLLCSTRQAVFCKPVTYSTGSMVAQSHKPGSTVGRKQEQPPSKEGRSSLTWPRAW
jgi:hypothetical protein